MNQNFYSVVLPDVGPYCAVAISTAGKVTQTFHNTLDELIARGEAIKDSGQNAYFALSSFRDGTSRRATNAAYTKTFFLDLDCGPGKPYPDQAAATSRLRKFIDDVGLPPPYIVNSGRGVHVYWPLTESVPTGSWIPLANRFKQLCLNQHFPFDPAVPADAARVLRMPDTFNFKGNDPLPVQVVHEGEPVLLQRIVDLLPAGPADLTSSRMFGDDDDFTKDVANASNFPPSEFARLAKKSLKGTGCAQIAFALKESQALEEPLWRAALSIAWRCVDGESAIHTLSREHPEYDPTETLAKAERTKGPTTCKWYQENYGDICRGCTHKVTSPILLARKIEAAEDTDGVYKVAQQLDPDNTELTTARVIEVEIPAYPFPYFRGVTGGVFVKTRDKDGDPIELEIYPYDLYVTNRHYDSDDYGEGEGEIVQVNLHTPHDGIRRFKAPVAALMSKDKLRDTLVKHGVVAYGKKVDDIMAYLASSVKHLQKMFASERTRSQMGWTPSNDGFVVGELEYSAATVRLAPASNSTRAVAPFLHSKGDLESWSKLANFYTRPGCEPHAFTVLLGFGSPLLKLCNTVNVRGAMINLYSNKGGSGKTTAQMVCNSIFGHPAELLLKKDDTLASKMQWLGMMNNIAVTMDEITNISDEDLSALVYEIPQGRAKHRMEAQLNKLRKNLSTWCAFVVTSSNSSMYDKIMRLKSIADGEVRRLLEIHVPPPEGVSKAESDMVFGELANHYGVAGPVFMQYVMNNMQGVLDLLNSVKTKLDAALSMEQADRFYSHVLACAITAGLICRQLGILNYDMKKMFDFAVDLITGIKRDVVDLMQDVSVVAREAINQYINDNINNLLIINAKAERNMPNAPIQSPKGALKLRYEPDTKELWIPASALRDLFVSRQIDIRTSLPRLAMMGFLKHEGKSVIKRISAGAIGELDLGPVRCFCVCGVTGGLDEFVPTAKSSTTEP